MTDLVNRNQAIFDAIIEAVTPAGPGSFEINTKKFIETFNSHRDRALCTSLNVTQAPDPYAGCGRAVTEPWNDVARQSTNQKAAIALMREIENLDHHGQYGRLAREAIAALAQAPSARPHDAPEWLWYGEVDGKPVVTFGRWPKGGTQWRYKWAEIQPTEHDHHVGPLHPDKALPDCMMPDGGECCEGYQTLLADWRRLRAVAQDQLTEVNIRRADKIAKMFDKPE